MVNLRLTSDEWFILLTHMNDLHKKYPDSNYLNSIVKKLEDKGEEVIMAIRNRDVSFDCEYKSKWVGDDLNNGQ